MLQEWLCGTSSLGRPARAIGNKGILTRESEITCDYASHHRDFHGLHYCGLSSLPKRAGAAERMRALGKYLMQMGDLPLPEFEEVVRINVWQLQGALASVIESQLRYYGETPDFWADDVRNYLDDLREALVG